VASDDTNPGKPCHGPTFIQTSAMSSSQRAYGNDNDRVGARLSRIPHAACMVSPQFVVAWRFHVGAYKALKRGAANMDVLVSLGTNASYFYSVMSVAHHHLMVGIAESRCSAVVASLNQVDRLGQS